MAHEISQDQEEQKLPYDYNEYTGFTPFGANVLMSEQGDLKDAEEVPQKIGAFTKVFVDHDPSVTEEQVAQKLRGPRISPEDNDKLFKLEMDARAARAGLELGHQYTHRELEKARETLRNLSDLQRARLEASFSQALAWDDETSAPQLFLRWNRGNQGSKMWIDWLMSDPASGGAQDEQLKNVLQWNEYQFRKINNDPMNKERIHMYELCYEQGSQRQLQQENLARNS